MKVIATDKAPAAVGPYSQAIQAGNMLFVSGQIPLVPGTGQFIEGGIKEQTRQCLNNLKAIIEESGASFNDTVRVGVFLADINDFAAMNDVYAEFFTEHKPARAAVEVANIPKGALVEIEAIAYIK